MFNLSPFLGIIECRAIKNKNHMAGWVTKVFKGSEYASGLYLQHLGVYLTEGRFSINVH